MKAKIAGKRCSEPPVWCGVLMQTEQTYAEFCSLYSQYYVILWLLQIANAK